MTALFTHEMEAAYRLYARDYERLHTATGAFRMTVSDRMKHARAALGGPELAMLDATAGMGRTIADLVRSTGRSKAYLTDLYLSACQKLAAHYAAAG